MPERRFVLSIDGGGMRGIVPALVLAEIEQRTGKPIADLFDLVGGTSTGGLLALGLVKPGGDGPQYRALDLVDLYAEEGDVIFAQSTLWKIRSLGGLAEERYDERPLEGLLRDKYFGETMTSEALAELVITSYDLHTSHPFFFKRSYAQERTDWDYPMWWVARSTSAAPTYFEPFLIEKRLPDEVDHVLVDGGVFANNPTLCAYVEALDKWGADTEVVVCSIGTGEKKGRGLTKEEVDGWGAGKWATTILDTVFDGVSDSVDYQMRILCRHGEGEHPRYYRLQIVIPQRMSAALDNATPEQVRALKGLGQELIQRSGEQLDALCRQLTEPRVSASANP
jgi:patatin-like phospholipase/acyl hydrolase